MSSERVFQTVSVLVQKGFLMDGSTSRRSSPPTLALQHHVSAIIVLSEFSSLFQEIALQDPSLFGFPIIAASPPPPPTIF